MKANEGDTVSVEYKGTLDDGSVFDESKEPLTFTIGNKQVIAGFEKGVLGMEVGEEKDIVIEPEDAYGKVNPQLIQDVPRDKLGDIKPEVGMVLGINLPNGQIPAKVVKFDENTVTLDINHPMAGKRLHFHIKRVN